MTLEKAKNQAKEALADLEESVLLALSDVESDGSHPLKSIDISHRLDFFGSAEVEIVQAVLNKLKIDGRVKNWGCSEDNWEIAHHGTSNE